MHVCHRSDARLLCRVDHSGRNCRTRDDVTAAMVTSPESGGAQVKKAQRTNWRTKMKARRTVDDASDLMCDIRRTFRIKNFFRKKNLSIRIINY